MKQIFHHYKLWEDYKYDFYNNCSGSIKEEKIKSAIDFFNQPKKVEEYMKRVVEEWKYSCEHNLTNPSMNKIEYLGQAACALYDKIPNTITMQSWNMLSEETRKKSNEIASLIIEEWNKKNIQTCLNLY